MTYDDTGDRIVHIYKDGVEVSYLQRGAIGGALRPDADTPLAFGATPLSGFYGFNGALDEIGIHSRVLTLAEIQTLAGYSGPKQSTTTALSVNDPPTSGQPVELVATVSSTAGIPAGAMTFRDGGTALGSAAVAASALAVLRTSALAPGGHSLTATFEGGAGWAASTSGISTYTVLHPTSIQLFASQSPSVYGQPITFTATVTSGAGIPNGTVVFRSSSYFSGDLSVMGTAALDPTGRASLTYNTLPYGIFTITATFEGAAPFAPSARGVNLMVQAPVVVTLTASPNPSNSGQAITFKASVTSTYGKPFGDVTILVDGAPAGTGTATDLNPDVRLTVSNLTSGSHTVLAQFVPTLSYLWLNATSNTIAQVVQTATTVASTATTLTGISNPTTFPGQPVTLTANVTSASGTPVGTVTFRDGATDLGSVAVNAAGQATFTTTALWVASHAITAAFAGNAGWANSTSNIVTQVVVVYIVGSINPIGLWTFDESSGATAADTSGNGNTATLVNATWTAGRLGSAVNVTGGVVNVGNPAALNDLTRFTWAFWANPTADVTRGIGPAIVKGFGSDTRKAFNFGPTGSSLPFSVNATVGSGGFSEAVAGTYSINTWAHWTLTYDDGGDRKIHIYKNGTEVAYRTQTAATGILRPDADAPVAFGATPGSGFFAFNGLLDDIRIYNRVLNYDEVRAFSPGSPTFTLLTVSGGYFVLAGQPVDLTATVTSTAGTPTGLVTFFDEVFKSIGSAPVDVSGRAVLNTALAVGTHHLRAGFVGDAGWSDSNSIAVNPRVVRQALVALTASRNPSPAGGPVTFAATVTSANGTGGTPTGPIQFFDSTTSLSPIITLDATGRASFTTSTLAPGLHTIQAAFQGGDTWSDVTTTISHLVEATTTTTLAATPNPTAGQPIVFTATVVSANGTPSGTVTLSNGAITLGSATVNAIGQATFTSTLAAGAQTITATFAGNTGWSASSGTLSITVQPAASATTTTIVTSSGNPVAAGEPVTIFATVTSPGGTPRGTIQFRENSLVLATGTLNANGNTSFTTSSLTPGSHLIHASFTGDAGWLASSSVNPLTQVIQIASAPTSIIVSSLPNPSAAGQMVTITARVTSSAGSPAGTVTFRDGTTDLGTAVVDGAGDARIATQTLALGNHALTAVFLGSTGWANSSSGTHTHGVQPSAGGPATTTVLTISPNPSTFGQPITLSALVTSPSGTPVGRVFFVDGTTGLGVSNVTASGTATITTADLAVGSHNIRASFSGAGWVSSIGTATQAVNSAGTSLVGLWTFNEGSGTTAADTSGNGNTATLVNAGWSGGPIGTPSVRVTGGIVNVGNPTVLNNLSRFTWAFFAKATADVTRGIGPVIEKGSGSDSRKSFNFGSTGSSLPFSVNAIVAADGRAFSEAASGTYSLNTWDHWALTYDDTGDRKLHIYKNSAEVTYRTQTAATGALRPDADTPFAFGATPNSGFFAFNGELDDVRIYNRVLAPAELRTLVGRVVPTTTLRVPSAVVVGQPATFTVTVTSDAGTPTGIVDISFPGNPVSGTLTLDASGQATFTTSALPAGSHPVGALYRGDGAWAGLSKLASEGDAGICERMRERCGGRWWIRQRCGRLVMTRHKRSWRSSSLPVPCINISKCQRLSLTS